jgi:hypothetical protein
VRSSYHAKAAPGSGRRTRLAQHVQYTGNHTFPLLGRHT